MPRPGHYRSRHIYYRAADRNERNRRGNNSLCLRNQSPYNSGVDRGPYPGTELYEQAKANNWFTDSALVADSGIQTSTLQYPSLSNAEIEDAVEQMYRRFYFRPKAILPIVREMLSDRQMLVRRLREGGEFFSYLKERRTQAAEHARTAQAG